MAGWAAPHSPAGPGEGLRERKKRLMRQQLSDSATAMFLERGFDAVRVAEVAEACGVSEKTVFNYFPTKESLVLDRLETTLESLRTGLAAPAVPPVQAALAILDRELSGMTAWLAAQDDPVRAGQAMQRFGDLIRATPSLRAYQADSLRKHLPGSPAPARVHELVTADVRRAARLIDTGLRSFAASRPDRDAPQLTPAVGGDPGLAAGESVSQAPPAAGGPAGGGPGWAGGGR